MAKSKGYRPSEREGRRVGHIAFEAGHEFHGAEIEVSLTAPVGLFLELSAFGEGDIQGAAAIQKFASAIRDFAESCLISWNVEDRHGEPVPATGDGLLMQDAEFITAILGAWTAEVGTPSAPLEQPSNDGSTSAAA